MRLRYRALSNRTEELTSALSFATEATFAMDITVVLPVTQQYTGYCETSQMLHSNVTFMRVKEASTVRL